MLGGGGAWQSALFYLVDASSQYMMHFQYTPKTSMTLFDVDQVSAGLLLLLVHCYYLRN